jgi:glucose-1-phosphate thymidylyltransferase
LNKLVEKDIRTKGELQLTDALQMMLDDGEKMKTFDVEGWYDCGKPETLLSTNKFLLDKKSSSGKFESVVVIPPVYIADNAKVENSVIGPYATIDKGCVIKESVIKNSIVGTNSQVSKAMLNGSIIGNNTIVKGAFKRLNIGDSTEIDFY